MAYTVSQLAKLSGVSVRALHWYDEVNLLKPAYYGNNGYRYYEEEQLLRLQQILFYRELDFPLDEIKKVLASNDFNQLSALFMHKKTLENSLEKSKRLIETIDKTINHIKGKKKMNTKEMYEGFDPAQQKADEKELREYLNKKRVSGVDEMFDEAKSRTQNWKQEDYHQAKDGCEKINEALIAFQKDKLDPESDTVQAIIEEHFQWLNNFWTPTKESYVALGELYCENSRFREYYDSQNPGLAEYLAKGMAYYAKVNLS